jgi:S1-C subfamily serine protease
VQRTAPRIAYAAAVAGFDPGDDIALLQVEGVSNLPSVTIGDSSGVAVGDHVTAIGASGQSGGAVEMQGAVTALRQTITTADADFANQSTLSGMVQFSVAIHAADCGGPIVGGNGLVIGLDTAGTDRVVRAQPGASIAYAMPINSVMAIVRDIESDTPNPKIFRGAGVILGVDVRDSASPAGAAVFGVEPVSPAQAGGIMVTDVIVEFDGTPVDSRFALEAGVQKHRPGDRVSVVWLDAAGQRHQATVRLVSGIAA